MFALALGCGRGAGVGGGQGAQTADADPPPPPCKKASAAEALAVFDGGRCGWQLTASGTEVTLVSLEPDNTPPPATGQLPEVCARGACDIVGREVALGPLLQLQVRSPYSEMPAGVWLGWVDGKALRFVDLWEGAGDPVVDQGTPIGPAFALEPVRCGESLGFAVGRRLPHGEGDPPDALQERAGIYGDTRSDLPSAGCTPVAWTMP